MTIREFAALCGVSPATASRFFSGQGSLSPAVRSRIAEVAKKTGYTPPENYRGRRKAGTTIAVVLPDLKHAFFSDIVARLRVHAEKHGKQLVLLVADRSDPRSVLLTLSSLSPMGVILLDESPDDKVAAAVASRNVPAIVCGALTMGRHFSSVHIDDMMAAYDGTGYLISLGHERIGILSDNSRAISSGFQRVTGCRKALEDAHLTLPDEYVLRVGTTFEQGYSGMETLLRQAPDLTAVFAFSDDVALGAMLYLQDHGLSVPDDISVLGFDDSSATRFARPPLTTVHQPLDAIAEQCVERLLQMQGTHDITSVTLSYHIVERKSCSAPRQNTL